jgi:hypothetical protein
VERKIRGVKKLHDILRQLRESGLFSSINVLKLVDEETVNLLKIKAEVSDGSILYINEMHTQYYQKYSYHWQETNGDLIIRWDNKPHWRELRTFPHHKHIGDRDNVVPSHRVTLEEVFTEIKKRKEIE